MTNGIDGTTNSFNFDFEKTVFFKNVFGQLLSEEIVGNDELQENVVYTEFVQ